MSDRYPRKGNRRDDTRKSTTGRFQGLENRDDSREHNQPSRRDSRGSKPRSESNRGRSGESGRQARPSNVQDLNRQSILPSSNRGEDRTFSRGRGSRDDRRHTIAADSFGMESLQTSLREGPPFRGYGYRPRRYDDRPPRYGNEGRDYRPKASVGTSIQPTTLDGNTLLTNHYKVSFPKDCCIYMYSVDVQPAVDILALEKRWQEELLDELKKYEQHPHKNVILSDKSRIIYCTRLIDSLNSFSFSRTQSKGEDKHVYVFNVKFLKSLILNEKNFKKDDKQVIQALETIFKYCSERFIEIHRCMFDINQNVTRVSYFSITKGLKERVIMKDLKTIYINVDLTYAAIIPKSQLQNVLQNLDPPIYINRGIKDISQEALNYASGILKGIEISCSHNSIRKKIVGFANKSANQHVFSYEIDGHKYETNVTDYFKKKYNINLKYPNFPLIQVAPVKKDLFLPVELLSVNKWQPLSGNNPDVVQSMVKHATLGGSTVRYNSTNQLVSDKFSDINDVLKGFGITVEKGMAEIDKSCLPGPAIHFQREITISKDGQFNCRDNFYQPSKIKHLNVLNACFQCNYHEILQVNLKKVARERGVEINKITSNIISERLIYQNFIKLAGRITSDCDFVLIIVPDMLPSETYGLIKSHFDISKGLMSQVIKAHHFTDMGPRGPKLDNVLRNVMLKINSKAGGINFYAELWSSLSKLISSDNSTMVMGADVTHTMNRSSEPGAVSLASIVSSLDDKFCKYTNQVNINSKGRDIIDNMEEITFTSVKRFQSTNGKAPTRIIMFRDGLSEGQHLHSRVCEIEAMKKALNSIAPHSPLLTFICVQKRHNTRFYSVPGNGTNYDCQPGTLVKDPNICDNTTFYLLSHQNIIGTAKSSQYKIILNELNFTIDDLANFSFILCHNYARCLRSVSIPCPTYYAHLCAFRSNYHRQVLEKGKNIVDAKSKITHSSSENTQIAINEYYRILKKTLTPHPNLEKRMYFI